MNNLNKIGGKKIALKKQTEYKGITAEYWRINKFDYNDVMDSASVHLWLYANKAASDAAKDANGLKREVLKITGLKAMTVPEELAEETNPRNLLKAMLYAKIKESKLDKEEKETNWFADSEDC